MSKTNKTFYAHLKTREGLTWSIEVPVVDESRNLRQNYFRYANRFLQHIPSEDKKVVNYTTRFGENLHPHFAGSYSTLTRSPASVEPSAPLVYIASPYSKGDSFLNVRRQIDAAEHLSSLGAVPLWPLHSAFWNLVYEHDWGFWMKLCYEQLKRCDALWRLPGNSTGADLEVELMEKINKPIFYSQDEMESWVKMQ